MKEYTEIRFEKGTAGNELLLASLYEAGFEGFEEEDESLKAFMPSEEYDGEQLKEIAERFEVSFTKNTIQPSNWNLAWETGFEPVTVGKFAAIRAGFHEPVKNVEHEVIITPKMSFGTGHHATTYLMIEGMQALQLQGKRVMDFGTGTGILAILAEKCGAANVLAIDNDEWSIENATENASNNGCKAITLRMAEIPESNYQFDVILANINKNIIIENLAALSKALTRDGSLLLSGLLEDDRDDIIAACARVELNPLEIKVRNKWLFLRVTY